MNKYFFLLLILLSPLAKAQFAPQAGVAGTAAIHASSNLFTSWATRCTVQRGYLDIANKQLGSPALGSNLDALGKADNQVVSLGDSGIAIVEFASPIFNGPGPDFAIFENGFGNPADPEEAFLEFAFVEVSSDGINFMRFPAVSNTQTSTQIKGSGDYLNARLINNLAGKYTAGYGTPFDLEEMDNIPGLDINHIVAIRLVDVIGSINNNFSLDDNNHIINDPYATPFPGGGFDLDAVGVIHGLVSIKAVSDPQDINIYPNPASDVVYISSGKPINKIRIYNISGNQVKEITDLQKNQIDISDLQSGIYFIKTDNESWVKKLSVY